MGKCEEEPLEGVGEVEEGGEEGEEKVLWFLALVVSLESEVLR